MQENSFLSKLESGEQISDNQTITITTEDGFKLIYSIETNPENKAKFIALGRAEITDRISAEDKAYPMEDIGVNIFYNDSKNITALEFTSIEMTSPQDCTTELHDFLDKANDSTVIALYKAIAFYWCTLEIGFGFLSGTMQVELEQTDSEDELET